MNTTLSILCSRGDTKITWDHNDPAATEKARREIEGLREKGYSFFLVSGEPADAVAAGRGELIVRRLDANEVVPAQPDDEPEPVSQLPESSDEAAPPKRRRGRPSKATDADRRVIAVRPVRGG